MHIKNRCNVKQAKVHDGYGSTVHCMVYLRTVTEVVIGKWRSRVCYHNRVWNQHGGFKENSVQKSGIFEHVLFGLEL